MKKIIKLYALITAIFMTSVFFALAAAESAPDPQFPYVKQKPNMCGAACLSMVYKSFGQDVTQDEIFEFTATPCLGTDKRGAKHPPTNPLYKMAQDPLNRGYHAIAMQAKDPMKFFLLFSRIKDRVRVILSMRPGPGLSHLIVFTDVTKKYLMFNDPGGKGPSYRLSREKFIKKWEPNYALVAISKDVLKAYNCPVCGKSVHDKVACPECGEGIPLEPKEALGCVDDGCPGKMWTLLLCPYCSSNITGIQNGVAKSLYRKKKK